MPFLEGFHGWVLPTTSTSGGSPWVQGGNSFGAIGVLGTNDSFPLTFVVNASEYGRFTTSGSFLLGATATLSTERLLVIGGITASDPTGKAAFLETGEGSNAPLSDPNSIRFIYDDVNLDARISVNGGPFAPLGIGAPSPWVDAGVYVAQVNPAHNVVIGSAIQIGAQQLQVLGAALYQPSVDSIAAFTVTDAATSAVLTVDTTNATVIANTLRVSESGGAYVEADDGAAAVVSSVGEGRLRYSNANLAWQASVNGGAWYNLVSTNTITSLGALPKLGKTLVVDAVNGNDLTGTVNGLPFATPEAALSYIVTNALTGVTVWILPGTYVLSAGITIPNSCSLRGLSTQTTTLSLVGINPGGTVTMLTMGTQTRVEDLTLLLTSTNATTNLVGVALPGTTSQTSKMRTCVLTVNNSGVATGSTTTVTGILSNGATPLTASAWTTNFCRGVTVSVLSNGGGAKRAILCSTASTITFRDTNIYCSTPADVASTGSYIAVETSNATALATFRNCAIGGGYDGPGAYTEADIYQSAPATGGSSTAYGIYLGGGTDLVNHRTGDKPFSVTYTGILSYSLRGNVPNAARYYWQGNQTIPDATEVFVRAQERTLIYGLFITLRQAPGVGQSVTVTVNKSTTGVPGSGVATSMTATISGASTTAEFYGTSVVFNRGEFFSVRSTATGGVAADLVVQLDTF